MASKSSNTVISMQHLASLLIRIVAGGLMFLQHGLPKLQKLFSGVEIKFANPIGIGDKPSFILVVFAEAICSILVMLGFFARLATVPIIITMLVIIFIVQQGKPLGDIELAIAYTMLFLFIALWGPGKYSVDSLRK